MNEHLLNVNTDKNGVEFSCLKCEFLLYMDRFEFTGFLPSRIVLWRNLENNKRLMCSLSDEEHRLKELLC